MKETEFWQRLDAQLGPGYSRVWAAEHNLSELRGRTVAQALADGWPAKQVWRAVWKELELPERER